MVHECPNCGHDGKHAPHKKVVCVGCGTTMENLEKHLLCSHERYTEADFTEEEAERGGMLYVAVVEGGLSICKRCGEYEAGLDNKCK